MPVPAPHKRSHLLSVIEKLLVRSQANEALTVEEIYAEFGSDNHMALIAFLCLPFFQPIPLPGLSVIFGILIFIICLFIALGREPHLPKALKYRKIGSSAMMSVLNYANRHWPQVQRVVRPRHRIWIYQRGILHLHLSLIAFAALLLALPLPVPATNSTPALVIFLNCLGQIEEDGLLIALSYLMMALVILFFLGLAYSARHFF